ncbi:MAG: hypothetical protein QM642_07670 [Edaphocola sp.]
MGKQAPNKTNSVFFGVALLLAIATALVLNIPRRAVENTVVVPPAPFGRANYSTMRADTFTALLRKAYGNLISDGRKENLLEINMRANELTKDFFNGNDALLKQDLTDYGFKIDYNPEQKSLHATFAISNGNAVNVPNDVLIKLVDKIANKPNVD